MKTNSLIHLADAVNEAVALQTQDPHVATDVRELARSTAMRTIAGIAVVDTSVVEGAKEERRKLFATYQQDAGELEAMLKKHGVEYLVTCPTKAWKTICAEHPLYTVQPDVDGRITVDATWLKDIESVVMKKISRIPLISFCVGGTMAAAGVIAGLGLGVYPLIGAVCAFFVGGKIVGACAERFYFEDDHVRTKALANLEVKLITRKLSGSSSETLRFLLPAHTEATKGVQVKIHLPNAPEDVQANLLRAAEHFDLTLHTVAEAVRLDEEVVTAFVRHRWSRYQELEQMAEARRQEIERQRQERLERMRDPIVTVSHGTATAIIVQYGGEFPVEQTVINRVLNSSALI